MRRNERRESRGSEVEISGWKVWETRFGEVKRGKLEAVRGNIGWRSGEN